MGSLRTIAVLVLLVPGCSDDTAPSADLSRPAEAGLAEQGVREASVDLKIGGDRALEGGPRDGTHGEGLTLTCGATIGGASTQGTVAGSPISATHAGAVQANLKGLVGYMIALFSGSGTCSALAAKVKSPALVITLCSSAAGSYAVGGNCIPDGGAGVSFKNGVTIPVASGADLKASAGSVTIESLDWSCGGKVKGSFSVSFGSDSLSGSFDTVGCGPINL